MTKTVDIQTSAGTFRIELDDANAPVSTQNSSTTCAPATTTAPCSTA